MVPVFRTFVVLFVQFAAKNSYLVSGSYVGFLYWPVHIRDAYHCFRLHSGDRAALSTIDGGSCNHTPAIHVLDLCRGLDVKACGPDMSRGPRRP